MGFINIIKPTKFKIVFCAIVFIIAAFSYWLGVFQVLGSVSGGIFILGILFLVLYWPAMAATSLISALFHLQKHFLICDYSSGICTSNTGLLLGISVIPFIIYVYIIACIVEVIVNKFRRKPNKSL